MGILDFLWASNVPHWIILLVNIAALTLIIWASKDRRFIICDTPWCRHRKNGECTLSIIQLSPYYYDRLDADERLLCEMYQGQPIELRSSLD